MATRKSARRIRLGFAITRTKLDSLPGIDPPKVKDILNAEAAKPMRGGNADLTPDSLFGDGRLQMELWF